MSIEACDLELISSFLEEAQECELLTEVVIFALQAMRMNPTLTIEQAISLGYNEWVK